MDDSRLPGQPQKPGAAVPVGAAALKSAGPESVDRRGLGRADLAVIS